MVDWTDIPDRNRGKKRPRYSANVSPNHPGQDDLRSYHLRNQAIQNANAVRERRATVENPQWAMSRNADWYQNRGNLASIKGTLANMPAVTTDQGEGRNMYQMLMNHMKGSDRGARLIDTRGLPNQAYRTGSRIFQDPSKSAGWQADLRSMVGDVIPWHSRRPNPAAIHVDEYSPFPNFGQEGEDWYRDQFPVASGVGSLMEMAEKSAPYIGSLAKMFSKERIPLERDPCYLEGGSEFLPEEGIYDEIPEIPFMGETISEDSGWMYPDDVGVEDVRQIPTDEELEATYNYILKNNAYSNADISNSTMMADYLDQPSIEQWKEMYRSDKGVIDRILSEMERAKEMGLR